MERRDFSNPLPLTGIRVTDSFCMRNYKRAAERVASYIASRIDPEEGKKRGYPGHEIAEMALMRLYELTGKREYLELASYFVNEQGRKPYYFDVERKLICPPGEPRYQYQQAHLPVREQKRSRCMPNTAFRIMRRQSLSISLIICGITGVRARCRSLPECAPDRI